MEGPFVVVAASRKNRKETVASRLVVSKPGKSSGSPWDLAALESATRSCRSHGAAQPSFDRTRTQVV